jgi:renalase
MRVGVIGAGISGIACARVLVDAGHQVVVLDRGRVPGGRMASRRFASSRYVDLGASYFTVSEPAFGVVVNAWEAAGLARPWTHRFAVWDGTFGAPKDGPVRWASPNGLRSLVAALAEGLDVRQGVHVKRVSRPAGTSGGGFEVDGDRYDAVVLAVPDPQALAVLDPALLLDSALPSLADRAWDPVLVLAARWDSKAWHFQDGVFVHGSDVLSWVADDGARRGDGAFVLTAHSTPAFAATRLAVPADAAPDLVAGLAALGVPEPAEVLRVQRWTFAKPVGPREPAFFLEDGLGLCGDGWGRSRVEGAWLSGTLLGEALT